MKTSVLVFHSRGETARRFSSIARRLGCRLRFSTRAEDAARLLSSVKPQLVVIAGDGPKADPCVLAAEIRRAAGDRCLLLVLVPKADGERAVLRAFESGADDVASEPVGADVVAARLRAMLRRLRPSSPPPAPTRRFQLDPEGRQARVEGKPVALTHSEFKVLALLVKRAGKTVTRDELLSALWQNAEGVRTRSVDVHVSNLRRKLGSSACRILSTRPFGYRFLAA